MPIMPVLDSWAFPRSTATAGTAIVVPSKPAPNRRSKISFLQFTSGGTAHTWYVMKEKGRTTAVAAVAGGGTSIVLAKDPGIYSTNAEWANRGITPSAADNAVAANDYLLVMLKDGTPRVLIPSAVSTDSATGRVTLTVPALPSAGIDANTPVWFMGVVTDLDPHYNAADQTITPPVSATTPYPNAGAAGGSIVASSFHQNSPFLLYNANATAASTLDAGTVIYTD